MKVRRPALKYFGSKWRIAPWIIEHFPSHLTYVEPFGGGAAVLLRKPRARFEIYNDLDSEVVNFFRVLRSRPGQLVRAINLTPFSRFEANLLPELGRSSLERARRLACRAWQTRNGPRSQWKGGWRFNTGLKSANRSAVDEWVRSDHLYAVAERLKYVQIECDDAFKVIKRFDQIQTLFYCDPPYLDEIRSVRWRHKAYKHEMTRESHIQLAKQLHAVKGMVILSGYASDLYAELYRGWDVVARIDRNDRAQKTTETLWLSPATAAAMKQQPLFK